MAAPKQQKTIFITGANGYVGSTTTELALAEGYAVRGLSRSESGDTKLRGLGAVPVRGDLTSLDVLRQEAAAADAVVHLATAHQLISSSDQAADPLAVDNAAVDALADGLAGSGKPLMTTSGTLIAAPDPTGAETDEESPEDPQPITTRGETDKRALALAGARGFRVAVVRLAPWVYGRGGSGVGLFMGGAAKSGGVMCVDGGAHRTTTVHVDDAARLYLLLARKAPPGGSTWNASSATDVRFRELFEAMAAAVGAPVQDVTKADAAAQMGDLLAFFLQAECRASGAKARKELGWEPKEMGILEEINKGSYQAVAEGLRKTST